MTRLRTVHQFHPTLSYGDAVSGDCFELQRLLWSHDVRADVFGVEAKPEVAPLVRGYQDLPRRRRNDELLLVHHSMGHDAVDEIVSWPGRKALVYHNITPAHFFAGVNEHARRYAEIGRGQLARLAAACEFAIADSDFNRRELTALGMANTSVVPILLDWAAYDVAPDAAVSRRLAEDRTAILVVGQISGAKALHDVLPAFARYRERDRDARLYLVGSATMSGAYAEGLRQLAAKLGIDGAVVFTGPVSHEELLAYYRGARVLLTLSDHEGFCVPLVEAMRFDLPIVAHAAGAIPDTLGDAGVLLVDTKAPDAVAEALGHVARDEALRRDMVERGRRRLAEFSRERVGERFRAALSQAGLTVPDGGPREVAVLSARDGPAREHALALTDGLLAHGHRATFVPVRERDSRDLARRVRALRRATQAVVVEYAPGVFDELALLRALAALRRRGIPVALGLHGLEPEAFHFFRTTTRALHYRQSYGAVAELARIGWVSLVLGWRFLKYRAVAWWLGALATRLGDYGAGTVRWVDLLGGDRAQRDAWPLLAVPLGEGDPPTPEQRRALRERLGLPVGAYLFVAPAGGAVERLVDVVAAVPDDAHLLVIPTGTADLGAARAVAAEQGLVNVRIDEDHARLRQAVAAADCVVLTDASLAPSLAAMGAIWAGLPCIFFAGDALHAYRAAAVVPRDAADLARAMRAVRSPATAAAVRRGTSALRRTLAPERTAPRAIAGLARAP